MMNKLFLLVLGVCLAGQGRAEITSELGISGLHFISEDYANNQDNSFTFIGAEIKSENADNDLFKINLVGKYTPTNSVLSYFNLKEIYFTNQIDTTAALHIGRRLKTWSAGDEKWNLGSYQPQFRWNPLDVESQGLVGVFYEKTFGHWNLGLFGTPFFIPDQGPAYEVKDGQFVSSNPYFTPPPQNIIFQNVVLPIDYNLMEPEIAEVVEQAGFGLMFGYEFDGLKATLAGTYKPSNQFALGYKGILVTNRVRVDVEPKTYYEKLTSFDLAKHWQKLYVGASALYNDPETPDFSANYNSPVIKANTTVMPYIGYKTEPIAFELAGLFIEGGEVTEIGPDANPDRQPLTQKYLYQSAYQVSLAYDSEVNGWLKLISSLQWREAEKNLLKTLKWQNIFDIKGPWKITLDLFLVETSDEATTVSNYRNLDQVWVGASYDF